MSRRSLRTAELLYIKPEGGQYAAVSLL